MSIVLEKRGSIELKKTTRYAKVGLGWLMNEIPGRPQYDFDVSVFCVGANGKCNRDEDFIYYNNLTGRGGFIVHSVDDTTGASEQQLGKDRGTDEMFVNDCETVTIDFNKIPEDIDKMVIACTIFQAEERRQTFRDAKKSYIRVVSVNDPDDEYGTEEVRFDNLGKEFEFGTGCIAAEIKRSGRRWVFSAIGEEFSGGLEVLLPKYGLKIG